METQRVFVENLPKPKRYRQEDMPVIIACIAVFISIYSADLARRDIISTHRPYVYVSNRSNLRCALHV